MSQVRIIMKLHTEKKVNSQLPSDEAENQEPVPEDSIIFSVEGDTYDFLFSEERESTPNNFAIKRKEICSEALFKHALHILNDILLIDEVFKDHPSLDNIKKYFAHTEVQTLKYDLNIYRRSPYNHNNPKLLIQEAKFFLNAAEGYGHEEASDLLKILNRQDLSHVVKTVNAGEHLLSSTHKNEIAKMHQLEEISLLTNPNIETIDDYIESLKPL